MVKKLIFSVFLAGLIFINLPPVPVFAGLVTIDKNGETIWKVLSSQDEISLGIKRSSLEVKNVASGVAEDTRIALKREDGKIYLNEFDVTDWQEALVEIEERGEAERAVIGVAGEQFTIEQNGILALTDFPIVIDPKENELALVTPSGSIFLSVLPTEAVESALRSRFINRLPEKKIFLKEEGVGTLAYTVIGEKVLDIFGILEYKIPVTARVSASTGEILGVQGPEWFKIFGFLIS